jgi:hypothetical protein
MFKMVLWGIFLLICLYGAGLNPLYWFFIGQFLRRPSWTVFFEFILAILINSATAAALLYATNIVNAIHILRERFLDPTQIRLEEINRDTLRELLPETLLHALVVATPLGDKRIRSKQNLMGSYERVRVFVRHYVAGPQDYRLKAYTSTVGTSFIFLNDKPEQGMGAYANYKFLHELAHISLDGVALTTYRYRRAATAIFAIGICATAGDILRVSFIGLTGYGALVALLAYGFYELRVYRYFPILFETKADIFALEFTQDAEARKEIIRLLEVEYDQERGHRKKELAHRLKAVKEFSLGAVLTNSNYLGSSRRMRSGWHYVPRSVTWNEPSVLPWLCGTVAAFFYGYSSTNVTNQSVWLGMLVIWAILQVPVCGIVFLYATSAQRSLEKRIREIMTM